MELVNDIPENHGLSSKSLLAFFNEIERLSLGINSFMLLQHGKVTAQFWRSPYRKDCSQLLYSLTKSVTSIAVGIAWDNGILDLQDQVISFFPDKLPRTVSPNLAKMTVHHLLSMNTGHHDHHYDTVAREKDWVRTFLSLDVEHEPGSHYVYNTHATYMLSAIIEQVTGQSLVDVLTPRLFEPLGIPRPSWETCPMGITAGGMGLSMTTEGVAKFGQMLLNKGMYNGQRIVSEAYIDLAASEQSDNRTNAERIDSMQGYGYQFHLCRQGCFRGDGSFGQLCFVAPEQNIVVAATASLTGGQQTQTLLDLIYEHIIGQLDYDARPNTQDHDAFQQKLFSMTYPVPVSQFVPYDVPNLNNRSYLMPENPQQLQQLRFAFSGERLEVSFCYEDETNDKVLPFDFTRPMHAQDLFTKDLSVHRQEVVTYASWLDYNTLKLTLIYIETPYVITYTMSFDNDFLQLQFHMNVALRPTVKEFHVIGKVISSREKGVFYR